jgi:hypothetical protein
MNERIDKLLVKAGAYFGGDGVVYDTFDPKKFAELIVRECARVYWSIDDGELHAEYVQSLKKHFGIEE